MRNLTCGSRILVSFTLCFHIMNTVLNVVALSEQFAVMGTRVSLPCNFSEPTNEDPITLVLWYKDEVKSPFYTVDARKGPLEYGRHFPSRDIGPRANFDVFSDPPTLNIEPVRAEDDGIYKCRIEFKRSRTLSEITYLHVIVPPRSVIIMDEHGQRLQDVVGPYDEGSRVAFLCEAEGGNPPPIVTWLREGELVDESFSHTTQGYVRNELVLPKLQRRDLLVTYTCQAANNNHSVPATSSVTIDMNLKPLDVRITSLQRSLPAGRKIEVECESWGARPKALLTWWIDSKKIESGSETFSKNLTTSSLTFVPTAEDNGRILACRAQNPALPDSVIENGWTLNVLFVPELKLTLGANIHPDAIKEGTDVFFECDVQANPPANEVRWRFNGRSLYSNTSAGIIVSNHSLVLQRVRKDHRGHYQCTATNSEGEGRSEEVMLKVKYAPVCRQTISAVHGVARYEAINVSCEVEADPSDVTFRWSLNNTVENIEIPAAAVNGTVSTVLYTPRTMLGYGALLCWGKNSIGRQRDPCVIRIIPAGPPESVKGCIVSNQTMDSLLVECEPGYDGGMIQMFHLEVYNTVVEHLQANFSSTDVPVFRATGLPPATSFILVLYASNAKGRSNSVAVVASTSSPPERRTTDKDAGKSLHKETTNLSPLLGVLIGVVVVLVILAIAIIIVMKRQGRDPDKGPPIEDNTIKCDMPLRKDTDDILETSVESPDVIPNSNDQGYSCETKKIKPDVEMTYDLIKSQDYPYDYITSVGKPQSLKRDEEITYADLALKDIQCSMVTRLDPQTEYAEIDFQRRLGIAAYPWPVEMEGSSTGMRTSEDGGGGGGGGGSYPLIGTTVQSKESLNIPETTTETTPL